MVSILRVVRSLFALVVLIAAASGCQADDPLSSEIKRVVEPEESSRGSADAGLSEGRAGAALARGDDAAGEAVDGVSDADELLDGASDPAAADLVDERVSVVAEGEARFDVEPSCGCDVGLMVAFDDPGAAELAVEAICGSLDGFWLLCDDVDVVEPGLLGAGEGVAFLSDRGEGMEWFVVDEVGLPARQLTDGMVSSDWSPDRSRLAYTTAGALVVVNADGSERRVLVEGPVLSPSWSFDDTRIAFEAQVGADEQSSHIAIVDADGANQRELVPGRAPRWASDGDFIMYDNPFGCCDNSGEGLWVTSILYLDSGDTFTIGGESRDGHIGRVDPLWSPDGVMVAYSHNGDAIMHLLPPQGCYDEPGYLCNESFHAWWTDSGRVVSWSPDASHIAYVESPEAPCAGACDKLWISTFDYSDSSAYIADIGYGRDFKWSPDGASIVFVSESDGGLKRVEILSVRGPEGFSHGGSEELATRGRHEQFMISLLGSFAPSWSADGSRIAFASVDTEHDDVEDADIYVATFDTERLVRLTEDQYHNTDPIWIQLPLPTTAPASTTMTISPVTTTTTPTVTE